MRNKKIAWMVKTAILSAISAILYMFVKFPLPIFPQFLNIQISNLPAIIGGFLLGPTSGTIVVIMRALLKVITIGTETTFVGELADILIGLSVVLTSSLIYKKYHSKNGAIVGLALSSLSWVVIAIIVNWLILIPFYLEFSFHGNVQGLISMFSMIPGIDDSNYMFLYLFVSVLPFNALLSIICNIITFFVYKRTHFMFEEIENDKLTNVKTHNKLIVGLSLVALNGLMIIGVAVSSSWPQEWYEWIGLFLIMMLGMILSILDLIFTIKRIKRN